jgi:predicted ribosomally synthesized peptide with SipW-like signal peptide
MRLYRKLRTHKLLATLVVVGAVSSVVAYGTYSAFTATTTNSGNSVTAGTVIINQHTGASTMFNITNTKPGDTFQKCVRVIYTGSITASAVKLYASAGITNGTLFNLTVERGSGMTTLDSTDSCAGFTPSSTAFAAANIGTFPTTYAAGVDGKAAAATWATNDSVDYRFTIATNDDPTANAHTSTVGTGTFSFTWEAHS